MNHIKKVLTILSVFFFSLHMIYGQNRMKPSKTGEPFGNFSGIIFDLCFSPSGKTLAIPESNNICFYNIDSKELINKWTSGHSDLILAVDISADGRILVSGGLDSTLLIRDFNSGEIIGKLNYHHGVITTLNLNKQKPLLASGSSDKTVVVYDIDRQRIVFTISDFKSDITKVKFSPHGELLAVASLDKTIRIYDSSEGKLIAILEGHKKSVRDLCFDENGSFLFSCGDDSRLIKWDLNNKSRIKIERVEDYYSDWLLSVDVTRDAYVTAGLDSKINLITNFATYNGKIGVPVNKILFVPNLGNTLKLVVGTRGKGAFLLNSLQLNLKN